MLRDPAQWVAHYHGTAEQQRLLRRYSLSDRMRYYWNKPPVEQAVARLVANLGECPIPQTLLSAYLPQQFDSVRNGKLAPGPVPFSCTRFATPSPPTPTPAAHQFARPGGHGGCLQSHPMTGLSPTVHPCYSFSTFSLLPFGD